MENQVIISNSSPLINLSKINKLGLIGKLFKKIIIPEAVYNELIVQGSAKSGSKRIKELIEAGIIEVKKAENLNFVKALEKDLDYGESEVIALALEMNAELIILDEADARRIAALYNLRKVGFIGILLKSQNEGFINNAIELLDLAIEKGFWINRKLYTKLKKNI